MRQTNVLEREAALDGTAEAPRAGTVAGWNRLALQAIRAVQPGLPAAARSLVLLHTCMYNAWAAYDDDARQTVHGVAVRLPRFERSATSKACAMSHAAWLALAASYPSQKAAFDAHMAGLGLETSPAASPFSPAGIGRAQAASMLAFCHQQEQALPAGQRTGGQGQDRRQGLPPARWSMLARRASERGGYGDDQDVRLYFALAHALSDTAVAADGSAAAAEVLRRFTGGRLAGKDETLEQALGRQAGALAFDRARRCWEGKS